jgi:hypothetical protein
MELDANQKALLDIERIGFLLQNPDKDLMMDALLYARTRF